MKGAEKKNVVKVAKNKKPSSEKQGKRALRRSNDDSNAALDETCDEVDENVRDAGNDQNKGDSPFRNKYAVKLMGYISSWNYREVAGGWKFNKVLQTWALDNIFDVEKIDAALYGALLPYVITIKGASVDRLLAKAEEIITTSTEDVGDKEADDEVTDRAIESTESKSKKWKKSHDENSIVDSRLKRAVRIKFEFSILNKTGST